MTKARPNSLIAGVVVGLLGALGIWLATPHVNFVLRVGFIADGQLPLGVVFLTCLLVLLLNPLLRRWAPRRALTSAQLAVALGIMLVASVPASGGLLRMLVHSLAMVPTRVSTDKPLAETYERLSLPPALFPEKLAYQADVPASTHFLDQLPSGAPIPWRKWLPPLAAWGGFMLFGFMMMVGMGVVVFTQWREKERLQFPLLTLQDSLIEDAQGSSCFGPLFRRRSFWVGAMVVFGLHFLAGLKEYNPGGVPAVPLSFDVSRLFTSSPFLFLPHYISRNRIYFTFIALAFFMPNRVGFSIWFWQVAYAVYIMYGQAYAPPFHMAAVSHHRSGAMAAVALGVLWLGRAHWLHVLRTMVRQAHTPEGQRERCAGAMFVVGCAGMVLWLVWVGTGWVWAVALVGMALVLCLVTTRMVAETGLIQVWLYESQLIDLARLIPAAWYNPVALFFVGIIGVIFGNGGRVCCPAMAGHAVGLAKRVPAARQRSLVALMLPVLLAGVVVCGAMHLVAGYGHATSLDGTWRPLTPWGASQFEHSHRLVRELEQGSLNNYAHRKYMHFGVGVALSAACQWLCLASPRWPLHAVGLLIVTQWHANLIWFNVLVGWGLKLLLLRYGGARLYRAARPCVLGVVVGELLAGVFWMLVGMLFIAWGLDYRIVPVMPY